VKADYQRVDRIPAIVGPNGEFTNFNRDADGLLTTRVTEEEATHYLTHHFFIEEKQ